MDKRSFPFELKSLDDQTGVFEGYAAVFGNMDEGGDVVEPGAFAKTLQERGQRVKICWQHDWREPIGKPLELREDAQGLFVKARLSDTQRGRDALTLLRDGVVDELSFGYETIKSEWGKDGDGQRVHLLKELRLYEISPVTVAMNEQARISAVKAAIPPHTTPKADEDVAWDAGAVLREVEGREKLRLIHAWVDEEGDPDAKGSYKLPHHLADGRVVWRGVAAAGAAIMGARGGAQIPEGDVSGVKRHLARHYGQFDKEPPWESEGKMAELDGFIEALCGLEDRAAAEPGEGPLTAQGLRAKALELELQLAMIGG